MPAAGCARGNLNQLAASQSERIGAPNTRTAAPQPQKARLEQPGGCATMVASEAAARRRECACHSRGLQIFCATPKPTARAMRSPRGDPPLPRRRQTADTEHLKRAFRKLSAPLNVFVYAGVLFLQERKSTE
jgi:hypothetical protein